MTPNWFVGLPVLDSGWLAPLLQGAPPGIRRFTSGDLHLTVAFLGPCSREAAEAAWQIAADLAEGSAPIPARLGALVGMGNARRPSAYSLTLLAGAEPAADLIGSWRDEVLSAAGAPLDLRPPRPHVTVARPPRRATDAVREAGLAWMRAQPPVGVEVVLGEVALYTWSADRQGRLFEIVSRRRLGADPSSCAPAR